jgi:hypothetical protein
MLKHALAGRMNEKITIQMMTKVRIHTGSEPEN